MIKKQWSDRFGREVWGYDARVGKRRRQKFGFSSEAAAKIALAKARVAAFDKEHGVAPPEPKPVVTLRQVLERRIKQLPVAKGASGYSSRKQAVRNLNRFLAWLEDPDMDVRSLQTAHLASFRDHELTKGLLPQSVVNLLVPVMSALASAHEHFPALAGWRPPARPKLTAPKGKKQVTYSPDDAARLLAHLRRPRETRHKRFRGGEQPHTYRARLDAADFLQVALQAGLRSCEILARAWSDVVWHASQLRVSNTKAGDEGTVFIPSSLVEMLRRRREAQRPRSEWIFPSALDPRQPRRWGYIGVIRAAAKHLRIPWGYKTKGGVVVHTARHTAATTMLDEGWDVATVQAQMRWSDKTMLLNYGHATARSRRGAASALDKFAGPEPGEKVSAFSSAPATKVTPMTRMSHASGKKGEKQVGRKSRRKRIS